MNYKLTGKESLGIELGSTRIKAVLIDENCSVIAQGSHNWENEFKDGYWTYSMQAVISGLQNCFKSLQADCEAKLGERLHELGSIGISAMMHGYLAFDANDNLLVPFRTWRNTTTAEAAAKLTENFRFNIPQRWSIAHLYQALLNKEEHVGSVASINTLAGYVHFLLSGEKVIGIGEASGMFPVNAEIKNYDDGMLRKFESLSGIKASKIFPKIMLAGDIAGSLTESGARLLDPEGDLRPGALMCPPEGDAGTGMVATNSIRPRTGNVSAGTSIFSMIVLEKPLSGIHEEIDIVSTPDGKDVAMIHCNNCCTEIDKWIDMLRSLFDFAGVEKSSGELYDILYSAALNGEADCGGVTDIGLYSGEPVAKVSDAKPFLLREKDASFTFANLSRSLIYSAFSVLKIGHDILDKAGVKVDRLNGHGGLFKAEHVGAKLMANALGTEIRVSKTAGEGGAWGMAILAEYALNGNGMLLSEYLDDVVFRNNEHYSEHPDEAGAEGFKAYHKRFCEAINYNSRGKS